MTSLKYQLPAFSKHWLSWSNHVEYGAVMNPKNANGEIGKARRPGRYHRIDPNNQTDRMEINQARRRFNAGAIHKTEVGFPRGRGDETTVGIPAGEVGGSPPSDWGPWSGVAAETVDRGRIRGGAGELSG